MFAQFVLLTMWSAPPQSHPAPVDRAWSILQEGLENKSPYTRAKAVHALAVLIGNRRAQERAENALADSDANVRVEAATSLGQIGGISARAKLKAALDDKEVKVVIAAANSLWTLKDPAAYEVYYALLTGERKGSNGLLQSELGTLKDRKAAEKLAFETGIGFVPFGGMTWEAWKTVTQDDTSPVRAAAAERLARDPDSKSADALAKACSDKKWRVRAAVVNAIAKRGDPALLGSIEPLLFDGNDTVRFDAAAAIIRLASISDERRRNPSN
jgi:HEAT repeat protein